MLDHTSAKNIKGRDLTMLATSSQSTAGCSTHLSSTQFIRTFHT